MAMEGFSRITALSLILALGACGPAEEGWGFPTPPTPQDPATPPSTPAPPPSALQSVVSSLTLPKSGTEHGVDLDGDGVVDNQVGRLIGQLRSLLHLELQPAVDEELKAGKAIVLYDLLAHSLVDDGTVELRAYVGRDQDEDPSNNFSGSETFVVERGVMEAVLPAAIVASELRSTQPKRSFTSIPFRTTTAVLPLVATHIQARVGPDGMRHGILAGAIPMAEAAKRLAQVIAAELDRVYKLPDAPPVTRKALSVLLDKNGDGTITPDEFKGSNAFGFLLHTADIDSDGDGTPDAISFGIAFRSVPCKFAPSPK
jgi:hypothetical protein